MSNDEKLQRLVIYMSLFNISRTKLAQRIGCDISTLNKYIRGTLKTDEDMFSKVIRGLGTMINSNIQMFLLYNYVERDLLADYNKLLDELNKYKAIN